MEEILKNEETQQQEVSESIENKTTEAESRLAELEQVVSEKDTEIERVRHSLR